MSNWTYQYKDDPTYGEGHVYDGEELVAIVAGTNWGNWREDGDNTFMHRTRLIAAAPDLLEALKGYISAVDQMNTSMDEGINVQGALSAIIGWADRANAAIAKATGESA